MRKGTTWSMDDTRMMTQNQFCHDSTQLTFCKIIEHASVCRHKPIHSALHGHIGAYMCTCNKEKVPKGHFSHSWSQLLYCYELDDITTLLMVESMLWYNEVC